MLTMMRYLEISFSLDSDKVTPEQVVPLIRISSGQARMLGA